MDDGRGKEFFFFESEEAKSCAALAPLKRLGIGVDATTDEPRIQ